MPVVFQEVVESGRSRNEVHRMVRPGSRNSPFKIVAGELTVARAKRGLNRNQGARTDPARRRARTKADPSIVVTAEQRDKISVMGRAQWDPQAIAETVRLPIANVKLELRRLRIERSYVADPADAEPARRVCLACGSVFYHPSNRRCPLCHEYEARVGMAAGYDEFSVGRRS